MEKRVRKTRVHLAVNGKDEPALFGLVSTDPDYKLSLKLNHKLQIALKHSSSVVIADKHGNEQVFGRFSDISGSPDSIIHLVSNRSGNDYLLKALKNIDFLLLIYDPLNNFELNTIPEKIRQVDTVTAVFPFELSSLKDKNSRYLF